jgi:hypothetical protein
VSRRHVHRPTASLRGAADVGLRLPDRRGQQHRVRNANDGRSHVDHSRTWAPLRGTSTRASRSTRRCRWNESCPGFTTRLRFYAARDGNLTDTWCWPGSYLRSGAVCVRSGGQASWHEKDAVTKRLPIAVGGLTSVVLVSSVSADEFTDSFASVKRRMAGHWSGELTGIDSTGEKFEGRRFHVRRNKRKWIGLGDMECRLARDRYVRG